MKSLYDTILNRIYDSVGGITENLAIVDDYNSPQKFTPLQKGNEIEKFFMFHIYILNINSVIYRFDSRGVYRDNNLEKVFASVNGLSLKTRQCELDSNIPYPKNQHEFLSEITDNWLTPWITANYEMAIKKGKIDYLDEVLLAQFEASTKQFKCSQRCILKSRFISTYPDIIIDDTIIDLKTNSNFSEFKSQWKQLLNQFIDFQIFKKYQNVKYGRISEEEKKLIFFPIEKICLCYYRYNTFFTVDLNTIINKNELTELMDVPHTYRHTLPVRSL